MRAKTMRLTVGEITEVLGITNETIRYYVKEGLIEPEKNPENNYWEYSSEDVLVISDILFYRYLGISLNNIKRIVHGLPLPEIGKVIDETEQEVRAKIEEYTICLENLKKWKNHYEEELEGIGKFRMSYMPASLRIGSELSSEEHIARYLKGRIKIAKEDWKFVSLSFFCDLKSESPVLYKYISLNKTARISERNLEHELVEEPSEYCLTTKVYFCDDIMEMVEPVLSYAKKNGIKLSGKIYGRERTNYYVNHERCCVYAIYAPVISDDEGSDDAAR